MMTLMLSLITMSILNILISLIEHPLAITLLIILQTMFICLIMGPISNTFWFSYILFLIFLGGMLVLFIYITTLASNEKFLLPNLIPLIPLFLIIMPFLFYYMYTLNNWNYKQEMNYLIDMTHDMYKNLIHLYNFPNTSLIYLTISYLLITFIAIVNVTKIFKGPLRHMTYE